MAYCVEMHLGDKKLVYRKSRRLLEMDPEYDYNPELKCRPKPKRKQTPVETPITATVIPPTAVVEWILNPAVLFSPESEKEAKEMEDRLNAITPWQPCDIV
jgi:hypothetical protein